MRNSKKKKHRKMLLEGASLEYTLKVLFAPKYVENTKKEDKVGEPRLIYRAC